MSPEKIKEVTIKVSKTVDLVDFCMLVNSMLLDYGSKGYISDEKMKACNDINHQVFKALWPYQETLTE